MEVAAGEVSSVRPRRTSRRGGGEARAVSRILHVSPAFLGSLGRFPGTQQLFAQKGFHSLLRTGYLLLRARAWPRAPYTGPCNSGQQLCLPDWHD